MTTKSLLIAGALTFSSFAFAGTKSYEFKLSEPATLGSTELKPGEYKIKVEGSQATLHDEQTGKSFTMNVKIEHAERKFDQTIVKSVNKDGKGQVLEIQLGGTDNRVEPVL
jgi:hypothetical protein